MGFKIQKPQLDQLLSHWQAKYNVYAPTIYSGGGTYSDTDCIRYGQIQSYQDLVLDLKSEYSYKEILTPISQTLLYFTEEQVKVSDGPTKGSVIFLRSCDIHSLKRLDQMYLSNGPEDFYYKRLRDNIKLVLIGCTSSFENCFCVDMGTNKTQDYSLSIEEAGDYYLLDCKDKDLEDYLISLNWEKANVSPDHPSENQVRVNIPEDLDISVSQSSMWESYDKRCIACGRCNYVCPTCTCFTMQDLYYSENGKVGERRRVTDSCMVDGFTDVAGGGAYRKTNGQRLRFRVLHKIYDFNQRNGYHMCVGCGRCDDICPEYISFSTCINKLESAMKEVRTNE